MNRQRDRVGRLDADDGDSLFPHRALEHPNPGLLYLNSALAEDLGLNLDRYDTSTLTALFAGNLLPLGAEPPVGGESARIAVSEGGSRWREVAEAGWTAPPTGHPAPSIIVFTVLSGLGLGMIFWIGLGLGGESHWFGWLAVPVTLAIAGLEPTSRFWLVSRRRSSALANSSRSRCSRFSSAKPA